MVENQRYVVSADYVFQYSRPIRKIAQNGFQSKFINEFLINNKTQNKPILVNNSRKYNGE